MVTLGKPDDITFQQLPSEFQYGDDFRAGFPLSVAKHSQAHGAGVGGAVIGDVGVINLGREGYGRGFERVGRGKAEVEAEEVVLQWI